MVVLTLIRDEFDQAQAAFGAWQNIYGTNYFTADATGDYWDVVIAQCMDRGNICSGNEIRSITDELRPTFVIVIGIAGGLCDPPRRPTQGNEHPTEQPRGRDDIRLGDILIADNLDYVEFLKVVDENTLSHRQFSFDQPSFWLRRNYLDAMTKTIDLSQLAGTPPDPESFSQRPPRFLFGQIISAEKIFSAEGFITDTVQEALLRPFQKALGVDMESIGIGRAIHETRQPYWYNPHYVVIRGISDLVGVHGNQTMRDKWKRFAARIASKVALELVRALPSS